MTDLAERPRVQETATKSPVSVKKLGHVVFKVSDVERSKRFYTEILNFRISDVNEQGMVFFNHANENASDHHTLAIAPAKAGESAQQPANDQLGLSHFAMQVDSVEELVAAREFFKQKGVHIRGEGRKGAGSNIGLEFDDPDGYHLELYCAMDQITPGGPSRPATQWDRTKTLEEARDKPLPGGW